MPNLASEVGHAVLITYNKDFMDIMLKLCQGWIHSREINKFLLNSIH
jgi:hypothetical protein